MTSINKPVVAADFNVWNGVYPSFREAPRVGLGHGCPVWRERNAKAARDLGFRTTVSLVETFRRQLAWMEASGTVARAEDEPYEDLLIDAYDRGELPDSARVNDFNPWWNETES